MLGKAYAREDILHHSFIVFLQISNWYDITNEANVCRYDRYPK